MRVKADNENLSDFLLPSKVFLITKSEKEGVSF